MTNELWRVGDLAERTGLSVRTLHHYDEIGLLVPSHRGSGGHRLYTERDLAKLERIVALKGFGLALDEIRECLARPVLPREVFRKRLAELRGRVAEGEKLVRRLEALEARFAARDEATLDEVIETVETMNQFEKYYTPEQLQQLKQRADALGPETIAAVQAEWPRLIAAMKAEMEKGTDPASPRVQELAKRWNELVQMFTGGDPGVTKSLGNYYKGEQGAAKQQGLDPALLAYVGKAHAARKA
jgi:DNA-binding transcriptional MerR regulator